MGFALFGLIALGCVAVLMFVLGRPLVAAAVYRLFRDPDPYPPEAAEAPTALDEHFKTAPREQRIDEAEVERLLKAFDWPRYATWLKEPS
jgi:hypothetical protein